MEVSKILTILAYSLLFIAIISFVFAIMYHYHFYWLSALSIYIFSFLGGFSIGQITVGLTFIPLILAIGHSFQWIKSQTQGRSEERRVGKDSRSKWSASCRK